MHKIVPVHGQKRNSGLDAIKGLLILLVILGHTKILKQNIYSAVNTVYAFHVACFLLLPFLSAPAVFSRAYFTKICVRYLSPFLLFYTLYSFANGLIKGKYAHLDGALYEYVYGLLIAGSRAINASCDLKLLWFLPALFTLSLLRSLLNSYPKYYTPFILGAVLCHLFAGELGLWRYDVPWGIIIVLYIFPLGLCAPKIIEWSQKMKFKFFIPLAFMILFTLSCFLTYHIDIGDLLLHGITNIQYLLLSDSLILLAITSLFLYKNHLGKIKTLCLCGRYSMALYLIQPIILLGLNHPHDGTGSLWPIYGLFNLFSLGLLAYLINISAQKLPRLYHLAFPRNPSDLHIHFSCTSETK